ncbi:MAG: hypothetical protein HGN29_01550 [Asgard group archaeon]|nr:hypothetical protein [Asgard group archaeon]
MGIVYDKYFKITRFDELFDLFHKDDDIDSAGRDFLYEQYDKSEKAQSIILLNNQKKEAWTSLHEVDKINLDNIKSEQYIKRDYSEVIVFLIKWDHIVIDNELEDILTDDQHFVWYLRDVYELSYSEIGSIREHMEKSANESTMRDIYMKARVKMKKLLELCDKYSDILRGIKSVK